MRHRFMTTDMAPGSIEPVYGPDVGTKFARDGEALPYPGNTIISAIDRDSDTAQQLRSCVRDLLPYTGTHFTFLPETSWHMTVFDLVCDRRRDAEHWSRFLDRDAPLDAVDHFMREATSSVEPPTRLAMAYHHVITQPGIGVIVQPTDEATRRSLASYRERISEVTGIRFPDHQSYRFHITLAYLVTSRRRHTTRPQLRCHRSRAATVDTSGHRARGSRAPLLRGHDPLLQRPSLGSILNQTTFEA